MTKRTSVSIQKIIDQTIRYEVTCNKIGHNYDFTMAETLKEAKEAKATPVNWCMTCNEEFYANKVGA